MENQKRRVSEWVNLGGQIVPAFRVDKLREQIRRGEIDSWDGIHASYEEMAAAYPLDKTRHAWEVYRLIDDAGNREWGAGSGEKIERSREQGAESGEVSGGHPFSCSERFKKELEKLILLRRSIAEQVYLSRAKDFGDPFRAITFRNRDEMEQIVGNAENNTFVKLVEERTRLGEETVRKLSARF